MELLTTIVIVLSLIFFWNRKNGISNKFPGIEKAYNTFQKLPTKEKDMIEKYIDDLIYIVKNNVKYLPADVLNREYTKKTINAFIWYYATCVFLKKIKHEQVYMILTIVLDKLDKENIIEFNNFELRIFNDDRFKTMPMMINLFNNSSVKDNTIILVFVEKYIESITGQKVRYMNQNTTSTKNIKSISITGIEASQENNLDYLDRPDKTETYWETRAEVGMFLQERFKKHEGFKWIRVEPMSPKFDDMSFAYKNKIFSVLIDIKYSNNNRLSIQEKDRLIHECNSNNLIPCVFPIKDKKALSFLSDEHWNLYDIRTNEIVNPLTIASDEKTIMSDYEFNNMAVDIVKNYIRKENMKFESYCDIIGVYPQIWFHDKNDELSWVYVTYSTSGKFNDANKEIDKLVKGIPQFNGYLAQVGLVCAEKEGPYRGSDFYIKFNGLEKVYAAHKETGHGYGIKIKMQ